MAAGRFPDDYRRIEHELELLRRTLERVERRQRVQSRRMVHAEAALAQILAILTTPSPHGAVKAILTIGGTGMPITVDTKNETATLSFEDRLDDATSAPDGAAITFTSSDDAIATVAADASNPLQADITPTGVGTVQIGSTSNGTALAPDGSPIPDPDPVSLEVDPGAAVGERLVLSTP